MDRGISHISIKEIVKEKGKEKGYSLKRISREIGKDTEYIRKVLKGQIISRPTVFKIAKLLEFPELCFIYEEMLERQRKKMKKN